MCQKSAAWNATETAYKHVTTRALGKRTPLRYEARPWVMLALSCLLTACYAMDSATSSCQHNPAYCAVVVGEETVVPTVRGGAEIASVDPCGEKVTRAMQQGTEKHLLALQCAQEKLGTLLPGRFSLEPRYRYDRSQGRKQLISEQEARALLQRGYGEELKGTLRPDVVIHSGNPLEVQAVYDFKFICPTSNTPSWKKYSDGHTHRGRDQGDLYYKAFDVAPTLVAPVWGIIRIFLSDTPSGASQYAFEYRGKSLDSPSFAHDTNSVCALCFWLPTDVLVRQGAPWLRELALELAAPLPFNSGHAGLAFNALTQLVGVSGELRPWCFRYPGMDVPDLSRLSLRLGTRVPGVHWLTFLGQPVLGELGGASGLRSRLVSPDISVHELDSDRALVTLGEWPNAGDTEQGHSLPLHRELARILEPWLYRRSPPWGGFPPEDLLRWERRFLD